MAASSVKSYPQLLKTAMTNKKLVYLCGAGSSMSLGKHNQSWSNWIITGKSYLSPHDQAEMDRMLASRTSDELINTVSFLIDRLKAQKNYDIFMTSTIGSLHPVNDTFIEALRMIWRTGDLIATTNYDLTIEEAVDGKTVSYSKPADVLSVINGGENKIIHLHGVYDRNNGIDDIVADNNQYKRIISNEGAQFVQNLIGTHSLVIVGCGGTVEDPNLSGFMSFAVEKLGITDVPYFYLMKKGDTVPSLPKNAVPVFYGDDYDDLSGFLSELAIIRLQHRANLKALASVNPYHHNPVATSAFGRMHFSNSFNEFVGREYEIKQLNVFLDRKEHFSWWAVLGDGGIGKSRMILEWLKRVPSHWFGFFTYNNQEDASQFTPFTDTIIVFDYILGKEQECVQTLKAYIDAFEEVPYKLRVLFVERNHSNGESDWLTMIKRMLDPEHRIEFDAGEFGTVLALSGLSSDDEKTYIEKYLQVYLPLLSPTAFIENCMLNKSDIAEKVETAFRNSMESLCYRPLFLSIYTEVWLNKEGQLSLNSAEELLSEYVNKEKNRWKLIFGDESLVDSYIRLLAMACAIEYFNITDVFGNNYLKKDTELLTEFFDKKSGKPGSTDEFSDLFVKMDELVEDDGEDPIANLFAHPKSEKNRMSEENIDFILAMEDDERFAHFAPYVKLHSDPCEVYLQTLADAGTADDELEELEKIRKERIQRVEALPDHAWIIEPVLPDIIKEFIVLYAVNKRDIIRFTKLARSNSVLGLADFINRALEDWGDKQIFQRMAVTPPDEVLNYFEYYVSLLISLRNVEDILAVEQALIDSDPCFPRYEMELWRRISVVLTDRGNTDRLYDSGCRFFEYLNSIDGKIQIRNEVANVVEAYCVGLHNAGATEKHKEFLSKCDALALVVPDNIELGKVLCESYCLLINAKLYRNRSLDITFEWEKITDYIKLYGYREDMCKGIIQTTYDFMITLIRKNDLDKLYQLEKFIEKVFKHIHIVEIAGVAALCSANIFSISHMKSKVCQSDEYNKVKQYYSNFPGSMYIRKAYLTVCRVYYLDSSTYRKVPDKLLNQAKEWARRYPEEIEFPEGYFGLLMARFEFALAHNQRNEQRRLFKEMKSVAERANYSEYQEENDMLEAVKMLQLHHGY